MLQFTQSGTSPCSGRSKRLTGSAAFVTAATLFLSGVVVADSVTYLNQGRGWTDAKRQAFYSQDQGSQVIPLSWMSALEFQGQPFMTDKLSRYGYLPNLEGANPDMPLGFSLASSPQGPMIGMTCSACHTRQIEVEGKAYRADGGPAIADFQAFLADLDVAVADVLDTESSFQKFAANVLGSGADVRTVAQLKKDLELWFLRFDTLVQKSLPEPGWGPSRLDAVSMIFNRLTGLDIGPPPGYMIPDNMQVADAPVRYPFLWNAARQDYTQWPGFSSNGNAILGLSRNLGEVYGVFAEFTPVKSSQYRLGVNYLGNNSANFHGLKELEELIWKIGPPQWPFQVDQEQARLGHEIYHRKTVNGGCVECHGKKPGKWRTLNPLRQHKIWATPILDVGTDTHEHEILARTAKTGSLEGSGLPGSKLGAEATSFDILANAVIGSILQHINPFDKQRKSLLAKDMNDLESLGLNAETKHLLSAFIKPGGDKKLAGEAGDSGGSGGFAYESRVMEGIWAAAPYLHNGSVPTLRELLKPASQRVKSFKIGPNYDTDAVGLAVDQDKFDYTLVTTGCDALNSGNSNCGHEFGTELSEDEKEALLEYLKVL